MVMNLGRAMVRIGAVGMVSLAAVWASGQPGGGERAEPAATDEAFRASLLDDAAARESLVRRDLSDDPRINVGGVIQSRFNINIRQQDAARSVDDFESGFLQRRTRFKLNGKLRLGDAEATVPWQIQTDASRSSGDLFLLDAWSGYEHGPWRIRVGQFVPPLTRESLVSNTRRMAVEVSPVTGAFSTVGGGGRTQGIEARYRQGDWTHWVMVSDGDGGGNRDFQDDEGDVGVYVRTERKIGEESWRRFADFTSKRGSATAVLLGAAGLVTVGEADEDGDGLQRESFYELTGTADVTVEGDGWSAFLSSSIMHRSAQGVDDINMFGVSGHVARYVTDDLELFSQYSFIAGEDEAGELSTIVAGFNRYFVGHTIKLTADTLYSFNEITEEYASGSRALLRDAPGEDGQVVIRAQFQLLF
ncbi:MAG: porin [Planctomycetota bacterium]